MIAAPTRFAIERRLRSSSSSPVGAMPILSDPLLELGDEVAEPPRQAARAASSCVYA